MEIKKTVITLIVFVFAAVAFPSSSWAEKPGEMITRKINESLLILRDPDLQDYERMAERQDKLWEILGPVFDFQEIAKRSLGRHWRERTAEERDEYTKLFTDILKNTYVTKSDSYSDEDIVYVRENIQGRRSKVQIHFITNDGKTINVELNLIDKNSSWKVYDVIIEGVSVVGNYRTQFNSILSKSPFEELIKKLKEKHDEIMDIEV